MTPLVATAVLCRRHTRLSRMEANLRISRDRTNLDLQMISHQVQRVQTQADDSCLLPDPLPARRSASLAGLPPASLRPGAPSSSADQSAVAQETVHVAPFTWEEVDRQYWLARVSGTASSDT